MVGEVEGGGIIPQVEVKNKKSSGHPKSDGMIRVTNAVEQVGGYR